MSKATNLNILIERCTEQYRRKFNQFDRAKRHYSGPRPGTSMEHLNKIQAKDERAVRLLKKLEKGIFPRGIVAYDLINLNLFPESPEE